MSEDLIRGSLQGLLWAVETHAVDEFAWRVTSHSATQIGPWAFAAFTKVDHVAAEG